MNIASELVNLKLSNDSLLDENEVLKIKVEELQKIADAQPAEVEERLKEEMERIMQRNIEVQNENRSLREECEEMEQELVGAKMNHAQVSWSVVGRWNEMVEMLMMVCRPSRIMMLYGNGGLLSKRL